MTHYMSSRTHGAIPHASIITQLCVTAGVRWGAEEQMQQQTADIDRSTISRLEEWPGGVPHPRGLGYVVSAAEEVVISPQGARAARSGRGARRQGAQSGLGDQQYRRLMRHIDAMHDINRSFVQEMTVSLDRVFARDGVQIDWPIYGAHQQYPPPDSPPGSPPEEGGPHAQ
ncbi:hypothetical protein POM88_050865 [Heracleum sosnowskyi]|uniref:Uncharacterized protein n=1 Tax=Heracleum sosnowskyi TaxID=360622 RepID=A0AAD8GZG0_9APIA|nr:hypothetical protein POM88_050865 [Heracleum sosnowskyi]